MRRPERLDGALVVYTSIFGAVLASMPALNTRLILSTRRSSISRTKSPILSTRFSGRNEGGTDIARLNYAVEMSSPTKTIFILITDLEDGEISTKR